MSFGPDIHDYCKCCDAEFDNEKVIEDGDSGVCIDCQSMREDLAASLAKEER